MGLKRIRLIMKRLRWLSLALLLFLFLAVLNRPSGSGPDLAVQQALMSALRLADRAM